MILITGLFGCDVRAPVAKLELLERALLVRQYNRSAWEREASVHRARRRRRCRWWRGDRGGRGREGGS